MEKNKGGRPLKFKTVKELQDKIDEYFDSCLDYKRDMFGGRIIDKECTEEYIDDNGKEHRKWEKHGFVMEQVKPFTVSGLAVHLGTTRDTLMDYESGKYDNKSEDGSDIDLTDEQMLINEQIEKFSDTIKKAKDKIYAYTEESLFTNKPTGAIFSLKNNYGWKDKTEQEVTNPDGSLTPIVRIIDERPKNISSDK